MVAVTLTHPIQANGETLEIIELGRPKVKHLKIMDTATGEMERAALLIGELAGIPPSSVDQLDAEDFTKLSEALAGFLGVSPATGAT